MGAPQAATKLVLMDPDARNSIIESMAPRAAANTLTSMEDALQNIMSQPGSPEVLAGWRPSQNYLHSVTLTSHCTVHVHDMMACVSRQSACRVTLGQSQEACQTVVSVWKACMCVKPL